MRFKKILTAAFMAAFALLSTPVTAVHASDIGTKTPVYRLYSPSLHSEYFTTNSVERDQYKRNGWLNLGVQGYVPTSSKVPVYKLEWNDHSWVFTTNKQKMLSYSKFSMCKYKGIAFYSSETQAIPVYVDYYAPGNPPSGSHYEYSDTAKGHQSAVSRGYTAQGIAWYYMNPNKPVATPKWNHSAPAPASKPASTPAPRRQSPTSQFPYVGTYGSVRLSSGYSVALEANTQANINRNYVAGYQEGVGNEAAFDRNGRILGHAKDPYTLIADHNYGTPAALPAAKNSNTMWIRHANGTVETLHKTYTVRTNAGFIDGSGRNWNSGTVVHRYGRVLFQTCDESGRGRYLTIWN